MKNRFAFIAVLLPLVAILFAIGSAELGRRQGEVYRVALAGYDPRDLLRGHYLRFTLDWEELDASHFGGAAPACDSEAGGLCCRCLVRVEIETPLTPLVPKTARTTCDFARDRCDGAILESELWGLNRFYIPESEAKRAEDLLRAGQQSGTAFLSLAVTGEGRANILDLEIGGESLADLFGE